MSLYHLSENDFCTDDVMFANDDVMSGNDDVMFANDW